MNSLPTVVFLIFCLILLGFNKADAMQCDACGADCSRACGTRHFRTCCFNYVRKRTNNLHPYGLNQLNYDFLYGPSQSLSDNPEFERKIKQNSREEENFENDLIGQTFNKPWKETDLEILHSQQQVPQKTSRQTPDSKQSSQQFIYDA